ncbi:MAG: endonuclease/exonuclease/phosphatase family protein [Bacteroidetes bacterium]|nr:endonuclease/exonuclease/phosphatase family protein [Bacteroidota bacterium]HQW47312.1 endonuclease/exonuclease/phosphatase [Chitinophagaceae bacterium]MBK7589410.1 endonuclease/exonuclease/phosphatase family protein [Bacteroidota bacterium]MBK8328126.1 endonuclease/exonuclease/phosphatase family protein [Bacteroidota bacterium]MBK9299430.1 endonuclease/exonuclease/phosphatase family protein [Bacteroidota bacterium]
MKKIVLLLCCVSFHYLQAQQKPVTAIGFYNLENYYDTINDPNTDDDEFTPNGANAYSPKVFIKKIENLATVIAQMGTEKTPDGVSFLGVAEIENEFVLKTLCAHPLLKSRNMKVVHFEGPDTRGVDCGFLYNPSKFKVLAARSLTVPIEEGDRPTRDVLYVTGKLEGDIVHVFVNHWPSRRGGEASTREKRKIAAAVSKKIIDSLMAIDPLTKVINMGDLNDDPVNASVTEVLQAKGKMEDVKSGGLFNPFYSFYKKGLGSMAYQDAWSLFDQIILSYGFFGKGNMGLKYIGAEVYNKSFMVEKFGNYRGYPKRSYSNGVWNDGYSDHYPTILYFTK